MIRILRQLKKVLVYIHEFGIGFTTKYTYYHVKGSIELKISLLLEYLRRDLDLDDINRISNKDTTIDSNEPFIWYFWWQGKSMLPDICKLCLTQLQKNNPQSSIRIITKDNYKEYVNISDRILFLLNNKKIGLALFSDILRNQLLYTHGGLWIDATMWSCKGFQYEEMCDYNWWSIKIPYEQLQKDSVGQMITNGKWAGFMQYGKKGNTVNGFVCRCFDSYFSKHDIIIDYFLQNLFIRLGYENNNKIHEIINRIPINNPNVYVLHTEMNNRFDLKQFENITSNTSFFKLTYKSNYLKKNSLGEDTFYEYLWKEDNL